MSDRLLKSGTAAAVLVVAFIAATISYQHLYSLALSHGEPQLDATLIPLAIDGTVITASLLMLRAARAGRRTPWLARLMLVAAVAMTVAANVAFGWRFAAWGVLMAGFPAAAFLGNAEATIMYGRQAETRADPPEFQAVPSDRIKAAEAWYAETVRVGNPAAVTKVQGKFSLTRREATEICTPALAGANGQPSD